MTSWRHELGAVGAAPLAIAAVTVVIFLFAQYALLPLTAGFEALQGRYCVDSDVSGTVVTNFFRLPRYPFVPVSESLLGGLVHMVSVQWTTEIVLWWASAFAACILALGVAHVLRPSEAVWRNLFLAVCSALGLLLALRVSATWDEFFLNLRHSWNLLHNGNFSANAAERIEATVDLLPFALAALISLITRMPLEDAALALSLAGNVLCIVGTFLLVGSRTNSPIAACTSAVVATLCPPFLYIGTTGFMASLFAAMFVFGFYFLGSPRAAGRRTGLGIIALMPLVRVEAAAFIVVFRLLVFLFDFLAAYRSPERSTVRLVKLAGRHLRTLVALLLPFLVMTLWRWLYFGDPTPVPVHYKATPLVMYMRFGIDQFFVVIESYALDKILLAAALPIAIYLAGRPAEESAFAGGLGVLTVGYTIGGGDWFPIQWARYQIPLIAMLLPLLLVSVVHLWRMNFPKLRIVAAAVAVAMAVFFVANPSGRSTSSYASIANDVATQINRWWRIDNLARFGQWMDATTPHSATIASSELATMMYFGRREMVALLGVANPYGAQTELQPLAVSPIIGRRRFPEVIQTEMPDVIAFFEPISVTGYDRDREVYRNVLTTNLFESTHMWIADYFAGSRESLEALGYRHVSVAVDQYIVGYWVSAAIYEFHMAALEALAAVPDGNLSFDYKFTPKHYIKTDGPCD